VSIFGLVNLCNTCNCCCYLILITVIISCELLQPRYDENHRGKTIFTGMQVQNDILLDLYLYIMNEYLVTKLNA
jgi:hypothetical protein